MGDFLATELKIPALDGFSLAATVLDADPAASLGRVVVIHAALGVPRQYYRSFAGFLAEAGFDVVTYDVRGNGQSRPPRMQDLQARMSDWPELDTAGVLAWSRDKWPDHKLLVVGHSSGGQTMGLVPNLNLVEGFVAVASIGGNAGHWTGLGNLPRRLILRFMWHILMPSLSHVFGHYPGKRLGLSNLPKGVALQWSRWCRHPDYLFGDPDLELEGYRNFRAPILAYSFKDDSYVSANHYQSVIGRFENADITWRNLHPTDVGLASIGHFGFFREPLRDNLWTEARDWLAQVQAGSGSGLRSIGGAGKR
jgi:predicted alpha/beta hydrolase